MRNDTGRFLILVREKPNKINSLNTSSGSAMTIGFATKKCPSSIDDGTFRDGWGAPSNATRVQKNRRLVSTVGETSKYFLLRQYRRSPGVAPNMKMTLSGRWAPPEATSSADIRAVRKFSGHVPPNWLAIVSREHRARLADDRDMVPGGLARSHAVSAHDCGDD